MAWLAEHLWEKWMLCLFGVSLKLLPPTTPPPPLHKSNQIKKFMFSSLVPVHDVTQCSTHCYCGNLNGAFSCVVFYIALFVEPYCEPELFRKSSSREVFVFDASIAADASTNALLLHRVHLYCTAMLVRPLPYFA